jgi:hypothetical protein
MGVCINCETHLIRRLVLSNQASGLRTHIIIVTLHESKRRQLIISTINEQKVYFNYLACLIRINAFFPSVLGVLGVLGVLDVLCGPLEVLPLLFPCLPFMTSPLSTIQLPFVIGAASSLSSSLLLSSSDSSEPELLSLSEEAAFVYFTEPSPLPFLLLKVYRMNR